MLIYKIMSSDEWQQFNADKIFIGSAVDKSDGFIHFSTKDQMAETANKHFVGQTNLVLVEVNETALGKTLKFETSRGGQLFPHLYGHLSMDAVRRFQIFEPDDQGVFHFPEEFSQ